MDLMLEKICHRAILRIYTLPDENPVVKIAQAAFQQRRIEKMAPPLRLLLRIFGLPSPATVETITPPQRTAQWTSPVETRILKKDDTSRSLEEDLATYKIFSDGSGYGGMTGTAAVLYKNGQPLTDAVLRYQLGPITEHTTYDAEGVGILLGLQLIDSHRSPGKLPPKIWPEHNQSDTTNSETDGQGKQHRKDIHNSMDTRTLRNRG
ncbi:hypothetical protein EV359DRAFT_84567 [Lentinula novae-zelandiae]|nr:hypothetical protein EV359DRAFT_84567 [Lentinula novae-zelandiae]